MAMNSCVVCNVPKVKLCPLSGNKSRENNYINKLETFTGESLDRDILITHFVCHTCISLLDNYSLFKDNIIKSCNVTPQITHKGDLKRLAKTPPSALRQSVADQISSSVEKLKRMTISRKRICFSDHAYSSLSSGISTSDAVDVLDPSLLITSCSDESLFRKIDNELCCCMKDSVLLKHKDVDSLCEKHMFHLIVHEMQEKCPTLLTVLNSSISKKESSEQRFATISTIFGMIMHSRSNKASAIQKIYSSLAIRYHADNELMSRMNKVHIMMSAESKRNIIAEYGEHLQDKLVKDVSEGRNGKLNGDNLDIRVITNDIRMQNKNKDYHFFASDYILDRVDESSMPVLTQTADQPHAKHFLPSADETSIYKDSLKVLLSRVLIQHIPAFSWMKNVAALPVHIPHLLEEAMAKKSTIHMLPVSLNNEVSYEGCIHIMDEYVKMVNSWYSKAGRGGELEDLKIPIGGDQLTRCRLQGAKSLRAGAHTQQERFEQLYPIIIELFHTLQDFLEKLCKKFLKMDHSRNVATLAHLKLVIQRTNVNGQVKARFKAHEDFVTLAGEAYFLAHVMKKFQMSSLDDSPKHQAIPDNIHLLHKQNKQNVANRVMEDIVNDIFIPFDSKSQEKSTCLLNMEMGTWRGQTETSVINNKVKVKVAIGDTSVVLEIPKDTVQKGCSVKLSGIEHHLKIKEQPSQSLNSTADELQDYVVNFLQWYFIIIQLQDAIHEGDVVRTNVLLKQMIPFFYSHSCLSKYFVECIDFILKTEFVLPPHYAMRVRAASFVNVRGGQGQNKAADMHKENEVKLLKDLIKGLGANKTEQSIVAISKAAPVVSSVVDNFDSMLDLKIVKSSHQKRSSKDDILAIINILQKEGLWDTSRVRSLQGFQHMRRSPFSLLDNSLLYRDIERTIQRLQRDLPYIDEEEEENDN